VSARPAAPRAGFSAVEVLLVLLIMSGIMLTITQILQTARGTRDLVHNVQELELAGPAILDQLERDLRALATFDREPAEWLVIESNVNQGLDADRIDFVSNTNSLVIFEGRERFLKADTNEVGYCLRENPRENDFLEIYRREDFGVDDEPLAGGRYTFLHDRVLGFDIQVYEKDGPDEEPLETWGTSDDKKQGLPARIEVALTLELAPRILKEQLRPMPRKVTYRRTIRFPEKLFVARQVQPVPRIPEVKPPQVGEGAPGVAGDGQTNTTATAGGDAGATDLPFNPFGGGGDGGAGAGSLGDILGGGGGGG
jgi:type II secretory pathway component PulJ